MRHHTIPRSVFILILALVALTLLVGTLSAFSNAHAAASVLAATTTVAPNRSARTLVPSITPVPGYIPGNLTGAMALAVALVLVILFGILWGGHRLRERKYFQK
jgi:hypothetical protein